MQAIVFQDFDWTTYISIRVITFTSQPHYAVIPHSHCCCITNWSEPNLGSIQSLFKRGSVPFHQNSTSFSLFSVTIISGFVLNPIPNMAEAFGIAGSAFGTVSLGLQLFTEISKYLNSVEGRDEDLERAKNYARDFQSSLIALETWASNTGISDADLERAISQGQANCAVAISDLSKTVSDLKPGSYTQQSHFKGPESYCQTKISIQEAELGELGKTIIQYNQRSTVRPNYFASVRELSTALLGINAKSSDQKKCLCYSNVHPRYTPDSRQYTYSTSRA